jgi:hypothetical protein
MPHRFFAGIAVLLSFACISPDAWAGKAGPEFRVNTHAAGDQDEPAIAMLTDGGFVVTWTSAGQDGSEEGIYAQRYHPGGGRFGNEFRVNTYKTNSQETSSVAGLANGGFVVTWSSLKATGGGVASDIYGQRYNAAGASFGTEFRVNTYVTSLQWTPSVTGLSNGGFVVVWASYGEDSSGFGIYGQRYSAAGAKTGQEFRVNSFTMNDQGGFQKAPRVALSNAGFVVTWSSSGQDGSLDGVYGQRYSATGGRAGNNFRINTHIADSQNEPSIAGLKNGSFVVTWTSNNQEGTNDGTLSGVYAQRFSSAGAKLGNEVRVNTYKLSEQDFSSVAALKDGGFIVTWESAGQPIGAPNGIHGQRYTAGGRRVGAEFKVSTNAVHSMYTPAVVGIQNGGFVVAWTSDGQDGSGFGVYGQRFSP